MVGLCDDVNYVNDYSLNSWVFAITRNDKKKQQQQITTIIFNEYVIDDKILCAVNICQYKKLIKWKKTNMNLIFLNFDKVKIDMSKNLF